MIRQRLVLAAAILSLSGLAACGDTSGGKTQETKGDVKEAVGGLTGNEELKQEGKTDQAVGNVKQAGENVKQAVGDAVK